MQKTQIKGEIKMSYEGVYENFADAMFKKGYTEINMNKLIWNIRYYVWRLKNE